MKTQERVWQTKAHLKIPADYHQVDAIPPFEGCGRFDRGVDVIQATVALELVSTRRAKVQHFEDGGNTNTAFNGDSDGRWSRL